MKISWVVLTYNRGDTVKKAISHNMANAGSEWHEMVWVDNGSTDHVRELMAEFRPEVSILHKTNLGVAKGYNAGMIMSRGDYIVITGCDVLMPDNWLAMFKEYVTQIPNTGVCAMYTGPLSECQERIRGERYEIGGLPIVPAMPIGRRIFRRELLADFGYFHEGFGLYGWDDVPWAYRAEKICQEKNLLCYVIPDKFGEHLGTEGINQYDGRDQSEYHRFKAREVANPEKHKLLSQLAEQRWPKFTPYP